MIAFKQHPLGKGFPPLDAEEFKKLTDDIRANGLRNPIVIYEGMILDGWNRYQAWIKSYGLMPMRRMREPQITIFEGGNPTMFVISQNIHRRHLTATQRAQLAAELLAEEEKRTKARESERKKGLASGDASPKGKSAAKVAKAVGVSQASVERAAKIKKSATPEIKKAVASGKMGLKEGARVAALELPRFGGQFIVFVSCSRLHQSYTPSAVCRRRRQKL
jgi:hypothetical protein